MCHGGGGGEPQTLTETLRVGVVLERPLGDLFRLIRRDAVQKRIARASTSSLLPRGWQVVGCCPPGRLRHLGHPSRLTPGCVGAEPLEDRAEGGSGAPSGCVHCLQAASCPCRGGGTWGHLSPLSWVAPCRV